MSLRVEGNARAARSAAASRRPELSRLCDERLARIVREDRGADAFVVLYERYRTQLLGYCRLLLGDDDDAQDALQSALAAAFAALREARRKAPIRPWLFTIVHNEAINVMRSRHPHVSLSAADTADSTGLLEDFVVERERLRLLWSDLAELPERQRRALLLKELRGLSHREVAAVLGGSTGAAKQTLVEARRSLMYCAMGRAMPCDAVCYALAASPRYAVRRRSIRAHLRGCAACAAFSQDARARRDSSDLFGAAA